MEIPKSYDSKSSEKKWQKYWEDNEIYKFDVNSNKEVFSVDTPPPTVSGKMHIGHALSYSQQDFIVRFQRMQGKNVFCPFGTDDNGLATERLIEKTKKIKARDMSRDEFVKLCNNTLDKELRPQYLADWKLIGMSCDWDIFYSTINKHSQKISQWSFIDLFKKNRVYRKDAPSMWCPNCQTGISQVECEDKELSSNFIEIIFKVSNKDLIISTTRPELLPACVAVFAHPSDKRYQQLFGKKAKVPLFNQLVPILPDKRANPEKGTGIVMCCTFGDQTDMEWQKAHNLPIITAISKDGRMSKVANKYEGLKVIEARKKIIEDLKKNKLLIKEKKIKHFVNVHERCKTEIEILKSEQWFIKYLDLKDKMLGWGASLNWYPKHMKVRYDHWVEGLQWDWLISRQRFFGVPFPLWYCKKCNEVILANEKDLPVDPIKNKPPIKKCSKCKSTDFIPEKDVLDTWATSSLTPNLAIDLFKDKKIYKKLYPMSLRPQAHDIITFWLFNTVVKARLHFNKNPWNDVVISGHALDPKGRKMSKSLGNVIEPHLMIEKYSADALRFWAAGSKLGDDLPFQEKDLVTGQKFITKIWNACRFAFMNLEDYENKKLKNLEIMDRWILSKLSRIIKSSTEWFDKYEFVRTKSDVENFFWHTLADNYLEIIKDRIYNPDKRSEEGKKSAQFALYTTMISITKMIAPIMPFITEELYQLYFNKFEKDKSIHSSSWPSLNLVDEKAEKVGDFFISILQDVRRAKSEKNLSMKTQVKKIFAKGKINKNEFAQIRDDLVAVTNAEEIAFERLKPDSKIKYETIIDME